MSLRVFLLICSDGLTHSPDRSNTRRARHAGRVDGDSLSLVVCREIPIHAGTETCRFLYVHLWHAPYTTHTPRTHIPYTHHTHTPPYTRTLYHTPYTHTPYTRTLHYTHTPHTYVHYTHTTHTHALYTRILHYTHNTHMESPVSGEGPPTHGESETGGGEVLVVPGSEGRPGALLSTRKQEIGCRCNPPPVAPNGGDTGRSSHKRHHGRHVWWDPP